MAIRRKTVTDLRDIGRDLDVYVNQYADEIVREYEQAWSHKGWGIGREQLHKLKNYVAGKIKVELVLSIDFNYPELNQVAGMTDELLRKSKAEEKARIRGLSVPVNIHKDDKQQYLHGAAATSRAHKQRIPRIEDR